MLLWIKRLIQLRRSNTVFQNFDKGGIKATTLNQSALILHRQNESGNKKVLCLFNFSTEDIPYTFCEPGSNWVKILDSGEAEWIEKEEKQKSLLPVFIEGSAGVIIPSLNVSVFSSED
jgi:hypothetical protein